jgi:hypothetical protein
VVLSTGAAIAAVTTAVVYSHLKLVKWSLNAEQPDVRAGQVQLLHRIGRTATLGILLAALGDDAGAAIVDATAWVVDAVGGLL